MRDPLRRLDGEREAVGHLVGPRLHQLGRRHAVEGVVDLDGGEARRVEGRGTAWPADRQDRSGPSTRDTSSRSSRWRSACFNRIRACRESHRASAVRDLLYLRDVTDKFHQMARETSTAVGRPKSFFLAVGIIVLWAISGPFFHFSDTWQLIINTGTTIVTFLMVFLIQNTQNRDSKAIHLKLDELLRAIARARNTLVDLENMSDDELAELEAEFTRLRKMACDEDGRRASSPRHARRRRAARRKSQRSRALGPCVPAAVELYGFPFFGIPYKWTPPREPV